ncbi:hypothetical protein [Terriglobus sp. TAA 43]|uniref:hypothetical protein n=1 Tax=Terriglobus sp. TAA 43 TaxID=278961 RepID=UPI0012ED7F2B|nr:hypothetical protein [Terriglobus sp. TAA 43]
MADVAERNMLVQNRIVHLVAHIGDLVPGIVHAVLQCGHHIVQRSVVRIVGSMGVGVGHLTASRS